MTSHAQMEFTIPNETVRVALAAYPRGNTLMKMRDALGTIYQDQSFTSLFPHNGRGKKRSTLWSGYKVHFTETCEQTLPHLITHVATTPAPRTDEAMTERIQTELSQADLSPGAHFVDAGMQAM